MVDRTADQIDMLAGVAPQSALFEIRRERPEAVDGVEHCRIAVLAPGNDLGAGLRAALAARMARLIGDAALAEVFDRRLEGDARERLRDIASGTSQGEDPLVAVMVAHANLVTLSPGDAGEDDIRRLTASGLNEMQIVALSELVAFVNFEARLIAGLSVLAERR